MLICLSLVSVWPRSVDNYSSLALTRKLIMKDKQSSARQLPTRIRSHMKSLSLSTQLQALGLVSCQRMSNMELTCGISLDMCLPKTVLFPAYEEEEEETEEEEEGDEEREEDEDTCLWWRLCQFSPLTPLQESPLATLSPAPLSV